MSDLDKTRLNFDATNLYPSAMRYNDSVYPKIETGYTFKHHTNDVFVNVFKSQTFNQDGNDSAIWKIKFYNPPNLIFQHLPIKEKIKNIETNRMKNGYFFDTLKLVGICEIVEMVGKVIRSYEGVIYRENFKISHFNKSYWKAI